MISTIHSINTSGQYNDAERYIKKNINKQLNVNDITQDMRPAGKAKIKNTIKEYNNALKKGLKLKDANGNIIGKMD